ncbi:MAG: ribonuclease H-like domain-containing protein [Anaerolineales bacterium]|nr:ribonuclease H-like domain-containing protein [Anaerolineales bacterium]MCX7754674.1 ribonuclease H-like domain-containing protein [Anaerolineales bacterium]MDW8277300.1 ribonuclease H-like domain-containing protein [Anaerolineales bacterium]
MSPSLSEKLQSLGVKIGAADLPPPTPRQRPSMLEETLGGRWQETRRGRVFVVERTYPAEYRHGRLPLSPLSKPGRLADWTGDERLREMDFSRLVFLDTETSGLAGGTGTYAFLIGMGRLKEGAFHLSMFFLQDPSEEAALLEAVAEFLAPFAALVTFNGKTFDAPLLRTRYTLHGIPCPFDGFAHLDLLPLARRLWRDRLPSRALKYLEEHVMQAVRGLQEVPGYEIPWLYFDYLRTRDPAPLKGVFYHNAMDVVAMAALLHLTAALLNDPHGSPIEHGLDVIALAKLFEDLNRPEDAARLYERSLQTELPEADFWQAIHRLSILHKRRGDLETARRLWEQAAAEGYLYAFVELAKYYEHTHKNLLAALHWTENALTHLRGNRSLAAYQQQHWLEDLTRRQQRLQAKLARRSSGH